MSCEVANTLLFTLLFLSLIKIKYITKYTLHVNI